MCSQAPTSAPTEEESGSKTVLIVVFVVIGVIVLAGVAYLVTRDGDAPAGGKATGGPRDENPVGA